MKVLTVLALLFVIAHGLSLDVSVTQAECTEVYFQLYDPGQDPPCPNINPVEGWSIRVTSSPSGVSAGTCSSFSLDNLYVDVDFWDDTCAAGNYKGICDIVATESILSGYYEIIDVNGSCFTVCANCTP